MALARKVPVVVVLGATGAGKSKLAMEIAQKFGGEVVSADAIQMYKGLDIVTNKVTEEERRLVKHHMLDFLDPLAKSTILDFTSTALPIIDNMRERCVVPVVCGGTNYYIEGLLWQILVNPEKANNVGEPPDDGKSTNEELYERLKVVDPERADVLHPNERRKVINSLKVFQDEGRPHSAILREQRDQLGGSLLGGPLRYPPDQLAVLWVQCDQGVLDKRCDQRVESMVDQGLVQELVEFHNDFNKRRKEEQGDFTVGIFQSIGFKEFHDYLLLDDEARRADEGRTAFEAGKARMKTATRQYARRQTKWIRQRFLRPDRHCPAVYSFDSSRPECWDERVRAPAFEVVEAFFAGRQPLQKPVDLSGRAYDVGESRRLYECPLCGVQLKGRLQYDAHVAGKRHRGRAADRRVSPGSPPVSAKISSNRTLGRDERVEAMKVLRSATRLPLKLVKDAIVAGPDAGKVLDFASSEKMMEARGLLEPYGVTVVAADDQHE